MPEEAFYLEGIQLAKRGIALDIQRFFPEIKIIKYIETFKKEETRTKQSETKNN